MGHTLLPGDPLVDPLVLAFDRLRRSDVEEAMRLIDLHGEAWLRARTGRSRPVGRFLWVGGRRYPLKATGYLAAQLAGGIERTDGNPVKVDRVIRALCRVGFDVT